MIVLFRVVPKPKLKSGVLYFVARVREPHGFLPWAYCAYCHVCINNASALDENRVDWGFVGFKVQQRPCHCIPELGYVYRSREEEAKNIIAFCNSWPFGSFVQKFTSHLLITGALRVVASCWSKLSSMVCINSNEEASCVVPWRFLYSLIFFRLLFCRHCSDTHATGHQLGTLCWSAWAEERVQIHEPSMTSKYWFSIVHVCSGSRFQRVFGCLQDWTVQSVWNKDRQMVILGHWTPLIRATMRLTPVNPDGECGPSGPEEVRKV